MAEIDETNVKVEDAQVIVAESVLKDIAEAIRKKLGVDTAYKPNEMADAIMSIPGEAKK